MRKRGIHLGWSNARGGRRTPLAAYGCALQGSLQGLVECRLRPLIFLLRYSSLLVFDFELEHFFLQCFEQHGRTIYRLGLGGRRFGNFNLDWTEIWHGHTPGAPGDVNRSAGKYNAEASQNVPAIFFQRIRSIDRWAEATAGAGIASRGGAAGLRATDGACASPLTLIPFGHCPCAGNFECERLADGSV